MQVFEEAFDGEQSVGPGFDRRRPASLKRLPAICSQTLSATSVSTGNPRFR